MTLKLAFRNIRRTIGDYAVYFVTLVLGVAVFYAFNSIEGQKVMFDLESNAQADFFRETQPAALKSLEAKTPLGYIGTTEADCAPLIVLLVSDEGGYFTGQSYMVDGGIHKHS